MTEDITDISFILPTFLVERWCWNARYYYVHTD